MLEPIIRQKQKCFVTISFVYLFIHISGFLQYFYTFKDAQLVNVTQGNIKTCNQGSVTKYMYYNMEFFTYRYPHILHLLSPVSKHGFQEFIHLFDCCLSLTQDCFSYKVIWRQLALWQYDERWKVSKRSVTNSSVNYVSLWEI